MSLFLPRETLLEPYYELTINGVKISDEMKRYIVSVEFEESDIEADIVRITVYDSKFVFANNMSLTKKAPLTLRLGHKKHHRLVFTGEVTHIEADYGDDALPVLVIGAINKTNQLTYEKRNRVWKNQRASDIVLAIAKSYGFKTNVTATKSIIEQVSQENETDSQLIQRLAQDEGMHWYLVSSTNTLYFGQRIQAINSIATVNYNSGDHSLLYFRPNFVEKNHTENIEESKSDISEKTGETVTQTTTGGSTTGQTPPQKSTFTIDGKTGKVTTFGSGGNEHADYK